MYRKRDRSQEQSRFFIFVREGMQSAGFVDGVWYGSGAVRVGDVPMPAVVAALVCGGDGECNGCSLSDAGGG